MIEKCTCKKIVGGSHTQLLNIINSENGDVHVLTSCVGHYHGGFLNYFSLHKAAMTVNVDTDMGGWSRLYLILKHKNTIQDLKCEYCNKEILSKDQILRVLVLFEFSVEPEMDIHLYIASLFPDAELGEFFSAEIKKQLRKD